MTANNKGHAATNDVTQDRACDCSLQTKLNILAHRLDVALEKLPVCHATDQISDIAGELRVLPQAMSCEHQTEERRRKLFDEISYRHESQMGGA